MSGGFFDAAFSYISGQEINRDRRSSDADTIEDIDQNDHLLEPLPPEPDTGSRSQATPATRGRGSAAQQVNASNPAVGGASSSSAPAPPAVPSNRTGQHNHRPHHGMRPRPDPPVDDLTDNFMEMDEGGAVGGGIGGPGGGGGIGGLPGSSSSTMDSHNDKMVHQDFHNDFGDLYDETSPGETKISNATAAAANSANNK